jgi:N-acetylglucosaminyldiphosphoundecaprenol N-acetyl-beta-D-mannosaminyltransferase
VIPAVGPMADHDSSRAASVPIVGVQVNNLSRSDAVDLIVRLLASDARTCHPIFIVNAHSLNLAAADPEYRRVLNAAHRVFGDGTGVRWAARLRGVRMKDNLVGTDLVPALFRQSAGLGYRYFLLGADERTISRAAPTCARLHPGWEQCGFHHGYCSQVDTPALIEKINAAAPHVLLVGMGNPLQELWIHRHREALKVPVCIGVGGLFHFWAGELRRAPEWVRQNGFEWAQILIQQPHKWRRYLVGNPVFLMRILRHTPREYVRETGLDGATRPSGSPW